MEEVHLFYRSFRPSQCRRLNIVRSEAKRCCLVDRKVVSAKDPRSTYRKVGQRIKNMTTITPSAQMLGHKVRAQHIGLYAGRMDAQRTI